MKNRNYKLLILCIVLLVLILIRYAFFIVRISGNSMHPTYENGDALVFSRTVTDVKYKDVIVLEFDGALYVKRITAVPGDKYYELSDDMITFFMLKRQFPTKGPEVYKTLKYETSLHTLQSDEYFVEGDAGSTSYDSKTYGPIHKSHILGKLILPYRDCKTCWFNL